ncbi:serine hydrolase [Promethearchaeum syntrophicum]|uniref:Serine hydrolase n=1 Tax=Promethearchaeum syntrophicum TaxID=2594042 RepID=A0A5B9DDN5_9ARCH|nr:serine hydrolase [Candidatus Prometheoarchaeum syntrophicum]
MELKHKRKLENLIIDLMQECKTPGLAIGIFQDGKEIYSEGFGARNLEENLPMTTDTLFGIGSITKSFTAIAIMQLVEQGKIDLDAAVSKYVHFELGFKDSPITIHHILSHSSGIPELDGSVHPLVVKMGEYKNIYPLSSENDFLRHVNNAKDEILYKPEEKFYYCNDMFEILRIIIEQNTNMKIADYIKENIFIPLEMTRSTYLKEDIESDPLQNSCIGYISTKDGKSIKPNPFPYDTFLGGAGGILSSVNELKNYLEMLVSGGKFKDKQIISKSSIEKLWTPVISTPYGGGKDPHYCYGWIREDDFFEDIFIHHSGSVDVSSGFVGIIPKLKLYIIAGENDGFTIGKTISRAAFALLQDRDVEIAAPILKSQRIIKKLTGKYTTYRNIYSAEIYQTNFVLMAKVEGDEGFLTYPLAPKDLDNLLFSIPSLSKTFGDVKFEIDEKTGKISFSFDRYIYHKK